MNLSSSEMQPPRVISLNAMLTTHTEKHVQEKLMVEMVGDGFAIHTYIIIIRSVLDPD